MTRLPTPLRPMFPLAKRGVLAATELAGPLTRRIPARPARPGPPRSLTASTPQYAAAHPGAGIRVEAVRPALELSRPQPIGLPADHLTFAGHRRATVPSALVAQLPEGRAVGHYGAAVSADDTLLFDLSPYYGAFRPSQHPIFLSWRLPTMENVPGTVAVLTTRGVDNYYHFVTDVLPRLDLLHRAGIEPDRYLVNRTTAFQRELLDMLGIAEGRTLTSADHPHIRADLLVVPSLPDSHLRAPPWIAQWLRQQFLPDQIGPPRRRLYVTRGGRKNTRRLENEAEVLDALAPRGFETVEPGSLSVAEQIRLFSEAEIVVGAHGAGLTNLVFCPVGAAVIELFPPDYVNVCFWALASAVGGLHYRYLVGDGLPKRPRRMLGVASDITVDPQRLERLVDEVT